MSKRAAVYMRVSTDKQDEQMQRHALLPFCEARGWTATQFVDVITGGKRSRPQLDAMMREVRARRLDAVVVYRFDRFARNAAHLVLTLDELRALGVDFVSSTESIDTTTPMGRAMFTIIAAIAELEREIIRGRIRDGLAARKAKGVVLGRAARASAEQVRKILEMRAEVPPRSWRKIAMALGLPVGTIRETWSRESRRAPPPKVELLPGERVNFRCPYPPGVHAPDCDCEGAGGPR